MIMPTTTGTVMKASEVMMLPKGMTRDVESSLIQCREYNHRLKGIPPKASREEHVVIMMLQLRIM